MPSLRILRLVVAVAMAVLGFISAGIALAAPKGSPWGANYFPNLPLVTHEGKSVRLYDDLIKDKIVIFSFIYASCKDQCPLVTANLARVEKLLGGRVGRDVFIYSVSIDPENDTPEVLKDYAMRYRAGPGWTFLTGKAEDVKQVRNKFRDTEPLDDHTGALKIGNDKTGQWVFTSAIDSPNYIVKVVADWIANWQPSNLPAGTAQVTAAAPRDGSRGGALFQKTCAACHHIGGGELIGPDLEGVTNRREHAWLVRFLIAPKEMLDAGDPIAAELYAKYKVRMPNLGLSARDAADLISFIGSRPVAAQK